MTSAQDLSKLRINRDDPPAPALAVASGIIPALRAARLPIVQALRHVG